MALHLSAQKIAAACLVVVFNLLDGGLTSIWIGVTGLEGEANLLLRWVIDIFGVAGLWSVKLATTGMYVVTIVAQSRARSEMNWLVDATLALVLACVNIVNVLMILETVV